MTIVRVALDVPVDTLFDYRAPEATAADIGRQVLVPFGKKMAVGVILERANASELPVERLKWVQEVRHDLPAFASDDLRLLRFAAEYYHAPLGTVVLSTLPTRLRKTAGPSTRKPHRARASGPVTAMPASADVPPVLNGEQSSAIAAIGSHLGAYH